MCGIYAAINRNSVIDNLLSGLSSLTYRGYDSAGIAVVNQGKIERRRAAGKLNQLSNVLEVSPIQGTVGIGHTRWATHGLPNEQNAHPHMTPRVAVAHNGIVENFGELRKMLESRGYIFESETDSETIAQLITYNMDLGFEPELALRQALVEIEGSFAVVVLFNELNNQLFASRKGSPMVIGKSEDGYYVSSDINALNSSVCSVTHLKDGDIARLTQDTVDVFDFEGQTLLRLSEKLQQEKRNNDKREHKHFMKKEILEQAYVFEKTWRHYFNNATGEFQIPDLPFDPKKLQRISLIACGTSYFASLTGKYLIEKYARIPVDVEIASEYRYRTPPVVKDSAAFFVSQSGETADTIAALNYAKSLSQPCIAIVNVQNSTMANESNAVMPTLAGQEIGVASTKAFTSQLTVFLVLSLALRKARGIDVAGQVDPMVSTLKEFPLLMNRYMEDTSAIEEIAKKLLDYQNMLFIGRGIAYPLAEEGALKLKEISYIHAEAYPAGELKHGPLALVDENMPVVVIAPHDKLMGKTLSNLREVASRGGKITLISDNYGIKQASDFIENSIEMPDVDPMLTPILYTLPLQLLAYCVALHKGLDVDQPRNLAKSVTVE